MHGVASYCGTSFLLRCSLPTESLLCFVRVCVCLIKRSISILYQELTVCAARKTRKNIEVRLKHERCHLLLRRFVFLRYMHETQTIILSLFIANWLSSWKPYTLPFTKTVSVIRSSIISILTFSTTATFIDLFCQNNAIGLCIITWNITFHY